MKLYRNQFLSKDYSFAQLNVLKRFPLMWRFDIISVENVKHGFAMNVARVSFIDGSLLIIPFLIFYSVF